MCFLHLDKVSYFAGEGTLFGQAQCEPQSSRTGQHGLGWAMHPAFGALVSVSSQHQGSGSQLPKATAGLEHTCRNNASSGPQFCKTGDAGDFVTAFGQLLLVLQDIFLSECSWLPHQ